MLQTQTVEPFTLGLLKSLQEKPYLEEFVLVGGTALALQIGHRRSVDLDFFTLAEYSAEHLFETLQRDFTIQEPFVKDRSTLIAEIEGVKVDFIRFRYHFRLPYLNAGGVRLLQIEDIAPMKLDAIAGRGRKRDFFDLYFLLKKYDLPQMMDLYQQMYHHNTVFHVWKSLTYFDDAESDADPYVFDPTVTWPLVKTTLENAVRAL